MLSLLERTEPKQRTTHALEEDCTAPKFEKEPKASRVAVLRRLQSKKDMQ